SLVANHRQRGDAKMEEAQGRQQLPYSFRDLKPLKQKPKSARVHIEAMLQVPRIWAEVEPFVVVNGTITGHKVLDFGKAVDVLKRHDDRGDGILAGFNLNDWQLIIALKSALRTRFEMNKQWKCTGYDGTKVIAPIAS